MSECPPNHLEHASEMLAKNSATLHQFAHPRCSGLVVFPCGDHWHVGHQSKKLKNRCMIRSGEK